MHYFYVLRNERKELYYGYSSNLRKRLFDHNEGNSFSTKGHIWKLMYYEAYLSEWDAKEREKQIKQFGQAWAQLRRRIKKSLNES
ncbi:MAG: GIY-YIG nuclease family protein [Patescibacteria group bacterium]|mgnify:CR=1